MKRFVDSVTVPGINLAIAIAFIGVGLVSLLRLPIDTALPVTLALAGLVAIVSFVAATDERPADVVIAALLLPIALFGFVFVSLSTASHPAYGAVLVAMGPLAYLGLTRLRARTRATT